MTAPQVTISDDYTGDVGDQSGAHRLTLPSATITKMSVGPMDNNVYLVTCSRTGEQLVIDAANDADRILGLLEASPGHLSAILTTHQHFDHWQALAAVATATRAPTAAGRIDAPEIPVAADRLVDDGDVVEVGELRLHAIHLVGHTPGSIALALEVDGATHLFTGDCLFPGGVGKTWEAGDFERLLDDVSTKLFDRYGDETKVHPGHGLDTTLGAERPHLGEWRERGW
ncbi:MBL fold metallo-hydrolase [Williamsia serinedens]|uniref:Glyoxylase, beta-lactamase superfamily II n=1 Tax=Williamsia serinedens TaxID=391736 RepID=A0ABT1H6Q1_9NOCA|nr:MBL fold metallo-hydrolase [Williamsia serinedens]MCP2162417.1 Glyoxylase, beta-lactamase superfamily II [Williamsia serinedens]